METPLDLRLSVTPFPVPGFVHDAMADYTRGSNRYLHQAPDLKEAIADRLGISVDWIWLTAGIDQAINVLCSRIGSSTHVFTPTYIGYSDAARFGTLVTHNAMGDGNYTIDTSHVPGASLIFVANPNNPVGMTDSATLCELAANNPGSAVVVDEAYIDFGGESMIGQVERFSNLYVLRSFSKSHGLAGMRIGYVVTQPSNHALFELESAWFAVSAPAAGAALSALDHDHHFAAMRRSIVDERTATVVALRAGGFDVEDTGMNAVLLTFANTQQASAFVGDMNSHGILLQAGNGGSNMGLAESCVRVAVGTPEQMARFRDAAAACGP